MKYKDAGVDIAAGNELVQLIKPVAEMTSTPGVIHSIGSFGSMFKIPSGYNSPVLVSSTDGIGTKLLVAINNNDYSTIGLDLIAMCANDIIAQGAKPLYFLDYLATGKLNVSRMQTVIEGIARGCLIADMALIGGETAEMPDVYKDDHFDVAGFCVGIVEEDKIITGDKIEEDDIILGLASSGLHSNGFSLVRKLIEKDVDLDSGLNSKSFIKTIMEPTRIYVTAILELLQTTEVLGMAHITGGGLTENIPRMLPSNLSANIDMSSWTLPDIFNIISEAGSVELNEMLKTFNCGIGMVICIKPENKKIAIDKLTAMGETIYHIGTIEKKLNRDPVIYSQ